VITNKNLKEYAKKGNLTAAKRVHARASAISSMAGTRENAVAASKGKRWRTEYRRQLQLVDSIKQRMAELNKVIPGLWNQFYAWDDPAYRDGVIKPKLDKAMREYDDLKDRLPGEEAKLPQILDHARRDGAEPGWFRDLRR